MRYSYLYLKKSIMPVNERLANTIREAFADLPDVEEKRMFSGVCFMVNGKMCICINNKELMCRLAPDVYAAALEKDGTRTMVQNGRLMKNFVFVSEDVLQNRKDFDYWITHALAFNQIAEPSRSKAKKK